MQVTFLPPPGAKVPPADAYPIPGLTGALPPTPATPTTAAAAGSSKQPAQSGQAQVVYTHSFDGLGLQAMLSNWSASLPPGAPDPCLPAGFTSSEGVVGAGQWGACRKGLAGLLPRAKGAACSWAAWGGCGLGNTYTPPLAGEEGRKGGAGDAEGCRDWMALYQGARHGAVQSVDAELAMLGRPDPPHDPWWPQTPQAHTLIPPCSTLPPLTVPTSCPPCQACCWALTMCSTRGMPWACPRALGPPPPAWRPMRARGRPGVAPPGPPSTSATSGGCRTSTCPRLGVGGVVCGSVWVCGCVWVCVGGRGCCGDGKGCCC
jgi:hypothetical protein